MSTTKADQFLAEARKDEQQRLAGYREKALKLFPHVCGRCTREFEGKKLRELTVHHRDHNHDNNPPDGSNWELLCIYCHDQEHMRGLNQYQTDNSADRQSGPSLGHSPFAYLAQRLKPGK